jgi:hypothetical protein
MTQPARRRLTLHEARAMPFEELLVHTYEQLERYEAPEVETTDEREARIDRTLDECADLYGWFNQLWSYFDHWTDAQAQTFGLKTFEYKGMRQKRDMFEKAASSAKRRWEGASRMVTQASRHEDEASTPRHRR